MVIRNSTSGFDRSTSRNSRQGRVNTRRSQHASSFVGRRTAQPFSRTTVNRFINNHYGNVQGNTSVFSRLHDSNTRQSSSNTQNNASFRSHDVSTRYDNLQQQRNSRFNDQRRGTWQQRRSDQQPRHVSSGSQQSSNASRPPCRHCGREWQAGHKCAEFYAAKSAKLDYSILPGPPVPHAISTMETTT
ncbi:hypothetical protein BC940DRAFT_356371 [Gongronella butleri]|nr:hypothetical protein BC940DRAFT_356371 [Gongronella butleri]